MAWTAIDSGNNDFLLHHDFFLLFFADSGCKTVLYSHLQIASGLDMLILSLFLFFYFGHKTFLLRSDENNTCISCFSILT
jgi:hypothetical protein